MPTNEQIAQRLLFAAWNHIAAYYFSLSRECEDLLRDFIWKGVKKLSEEQDSSKELAIALAEANIIAFTTRMMIEAHREGGNVLHEHTFREAFSALCPLWPFC